jgi:hypothetical protein
MDIEAIEDSESFSEINYYGSGSSSTGGGGDGVGDIGIGGPPPGISPEPIIIRGSGNITVFGLHNRFKSDFPPTLLARVAPEEFKLTIEKVNSVLRKSLPLQLKWIIFGCLCCCCTLGCSFWPVVCLSKKTKLSLEKLLEWENNHLYRKLGLKWKLVQMHLDNSALLEYVLMIEFIPKLNLHAPD